ncbi:ABC transporter permease [Kutzneria buriramensis]|uniref:Transport permease protein n=1 Tax=Kutzneria buriramensis TaxID=1045776 RepID=A0A3E0GTU8_9PSEU|nr:ABC transporter permease [Kutzneria buriramensis]REH26970.1 ABC transporter DrrB family efflux protein [Kutzneria buriramensis]
MTTAVVDTLTMLDRKLRHLRRAPGELLGVTLTPVTMVVVVGYLLNKAITMPGNANYLDFMMAGAGAQVGLGCFGTSAISVADDLRNGLVDRFRSLPVHRIPVLLAQTLSDLALTGVGMALAGAVGWLLGWRIHTGLLPALAGFALLLALTFLLSWFGVLAGLVVHSMSAVNSLSGLVLVVGSFLSSAFVPLSSLPGWLRPVAEWSPISTVVTATRQLWGNPVANTGDSLAITHPAAAALATIAFLIIAVVPLSARLYRTASEKSR